MDRQWRKCLNQIFMALVIEIILNCLGLDQLADYSEFVFKTESIKKNQVVMAVEAFGIYNN